MEEPELDDDDDDELLWVDSLSLELSWLSDDEDLFPELGYEGAINQQNVLLFRS
jgi:hypothetical protein